jgi:hypothetical protein
MEMHDLSALNPPALLALHARILGELRARGVVRSANSPTGDFAEYLFCKAFGWAQENNAKAHIDARDQAGNRYQIKARRPTPSNPSRQLSALRDLDGAHFNFLAGVIFSESYGVRRAAIIPYAVIHARATFVPRTNSYKFFLHDDIWSAPDVRDVTAELQEVIKAWG